MANVSGNNMIGTSSGFMRFMLIMAVGTLLTWITGLSDIQYTGEEILAFHTGFPGELTQWKATGEAANITFKSDAVHIARHSSGRSYATRTYPLPQIDQEPGRAIRVRGKIVTEKKAGEDRHGTPAAYMVWFLDANKEGIQYSTIQNMTGDFPEYRAERVLSAPPGAEFVVVALHNNESDGHFALTDASVAMVSIGKLYRYVGTLLIIFWSVLLLYAIYWLAGKITPGQTVMMGVLITATFVGALLPETVTNNLILPGLAKMNELMSIKTDYQLGVLYKIGHFVFFFLVSLFALTTLISHSQSRLPVLILLLLLALATEGLQLHLFHRSTKLTDLGIDLAGISLAMMLTLRRTGRRRPPI